MATGRNRSAQATAVGVRYTSMTTVNGHFNMAARMRLESHPMFTMELFDCMTIMRIGYGLPVSNASRMTSEEGVVSMSFALSGYFSLPKRLSELSRSVSMALRAYAWM